MKRSLFAFSLVLLGLTGCGTGLLSSSSDYKLDLSWTASCNAVFSSSTVGCLTTQGSGYLGGGGTIQLTLPGKSFTPAHIVLDEYSYANTPINVSGANCQNNVSGPKIGQLTAVLSVGGSPRDTATVPVVCLKASRP
jgi:hypothetical protein